MMKKVIEALQPLKEALNADGTDLKIEASERNIKLEIIVTEKTCVECLLPEKLITNIIQKKLADSGITYDSFELIYPEVG
ncbi:hypothetical protein ACIFOT_15815 [Neobacillus sp. NRS-1170]|uniref:hypothetical protein n=1 Tax=Neobacillus sp. NRS-1170 TaxID=3233898 RepID=UPI003D2BF94E